LQVNQLEAAALDGELIDMFLDQVLHCSIRIALYLWHLQAEFAQRRSTFACNEKPLLPARYYHKRRAKVLRRVRANSGSLTTAWQTGETGVYTSSARTAGGHQP